MCDKDRPSEMEVDLQKPSRTELFPNFSWHCLNKRMLLSQGLRNLFLKNSVVQLLFSYFRNKFLLKELAIKMVRFLYYDGGLI